MASNETRTENPLMTCFETSKPKQVQIAQAVRVLLQMLDKPENPPMMERWAQILTPFRSEQLAEAFSTVAMTSHGWPTPGDITDLIFEREYAADFTWLLATLARHGADWQDRPPVYGEMWRKLGAGMDDWQPGELKEKAIPAPLMPPRLDAALVTVGGSMKAGLAFIQRHPFFWSPRYGGDEAMRTKAQIEKEFKAAWLQARRREIGGSL